MISSETILKLLNEQIGHELSASSLYLSMANWFEFKGLEGLASYFYGASCEERDHAIKIANYIISRGEKAYIPKIEAPINEFASPLDAAIMTQDQEQKVTALLSNIRQTALAESDHLTFEFLSWFMDEQTKSEDDAKQLVSDLSLVVNDGCGLLQIDKKWADTKVRVELDLED